MVDVKAANRRECATCGVVWDSLKDGKDHPVLGCMHQLRLQIAAQKTVIKIQAARIKKLERL